MLMSAFLPREPQLQLEKTREVMSTRGCRFILSYVPGGERGLRFMTSLFTGFVSRGSSTVLPV